VPGEAQRSMADPVRPAAPAHRRITLGIAERSE
jgi:hypothetical protein